MVPLQENIMANIRVRHTKIFKYLTISAATLGVVSSGTFAVMMGIDATNENFINDNLREYNATFSNEGTVISSKTYKRGDLVEVPENPSHSVDGQNMYFFIGWDLTGNGVPDIMPPRIYYSFNAEAVYLKTGPFDLSFLDLTNMDLEQLLQLMENLNIDWEQFMEMFGIDLEQLMELLNKPVIEFEADISQYISYFRATSFGDFNYATKKYSNPSFYDSTLIRDGSINPLSYTADKLNSAYNLTGTLPSTFDFVNYDITFLAQSEYYAVPDCEHSSTTNDIVDSDAHYVKTPPDLKYYTKAAYVPAMDNVIDILKFVPFSNSAITKDEKDYYKYALEHYTSIPKEYEEVIDNMIKENGWYEEDYSQVNSIGAYIENLGSCSLFKDGEINLNYEKNDDPVFGMLENHSGTDQDFNTIAVMLFRRLNIPARMVKGYVVPQIVAGTNTISFLNQHYWCEIYVKNIGWMICDCMNAEDFLGMNPYGELDKESNPLEDKHNLDSIKVTPPTKTEYYVGESLSYAGGYITAYFTDDTDERVAFRSTGVSITGFDSSTPGEYTVTVSYTYKGVTKTDTFVVTVVEHNAELDRVEFDFTNVKTEYYVGEEFTDENIVATAYYTDDTTSDVSSLVTTDGSDYMTSAVGNYTVVATVTIDGVDYSDTYQILVKEDNPVSLNIVSAPDTLTYYTHEQFDPTGIVVTITYESGKTVEMPINDITFMNTDFLTANPSQEIYVQYYTPNGVLEDTFVVEVLDNPIVSVTPHGYQQTYEVGDSFIEGEFTGNGDAYLEVELESGVTIKVEEGEFDISYSTPDLGSIGNASSTASFDYNGVPVNIDIPIEVTSVESKAFGVSPRVSTAGPGSGNISNEPVFSYTTDYVGTLYFRNASYGTYASRYGWSNSGASQYTFNPSGFVYEKAKEVYRSYDVTINFEYGPMQYGLHPIYADLSAGYAYGDEMHDEYLYDGMVAQNTSETFAMTNFEISDLNVERLANVVSFSSAARIVYNSYRPTPYSSNSRYTTYTADNSEAYSVVEDYIESHPNYRSIYNIDNLTDRVNLILEVKHDIQTEHVYDINFKYDSATDPIVSFFQQKRGICNNFASAAVMVYRHLGIPARFVVGYGTNSNGGTTTVTAKRAHAWTEVWIDGLGWVTVDATGYSDGDMLDLSGDYGSGFGGGGIDQVPTIVYGGEIAINYNYAAEFIDGNADGYGWYAIFDDRDHHNVGSWSFVESNVRLPDFLDIEIYYEWDPDGDGIYEEFISTDYDPIVDYGDYELVPHIRVVDKTTGADVTGDYTFTLQAGQENLRYQIYPAYIYVQVVPVDDNDNYSLSGNGGPINFGADNYTYEVRVAVNELTPDNPFADIIDTLPSSIRVDLYGYITFDVEGNQLIVFIVSDSADPSGALTVVFSYKDGRYFNQDNIVVIPEYVGVDIKP